MKLVLLSNTHDSVGSEDRPPDRPLVADCEGYSIAGDQLVVAQSAGQVPRLPFVALEHHSLVFAHDETGSPSVKPTVGLMHVTVKMADNIGVYKFWATSIVNGADGSPIFVQPDDAQDKVVFLSRSKIASIATSDPLTPEQIAEMEAEMAEAAELAEAAEAKQADADDDGSPEGDEGETTEHVAEPVEEAAEIVEEA